MEKKRIAVLFGGCSAEYEVSIRSAYSIITNIDTDDYETVLIGITRDGRWYRYYGDAAKIPEDTWHVDRKHLTPVIVSPNRKECKVIEIEGETIKESSIDIAFPVLHGKNGEDGTVQGLFELAGIPLVGCGTLASALCMDKDRAHKLAAAAGVKVPSSVVFDHLPAGQEILGKAKHLSCPLFVKPVRSGSSIGITKVYKRNELPHAVNKAFEYDSRVIVEESIDGFEVGCAVLGNEELFIGEVDEVELGGVLLDYAEKYSMKNARVHMPARVDAQTAARIKDTAAVIYRALDCSGFARVDMFLTPGKEIVFNEVNTIPGFTPYSRYPNMMKGSGLRFADIVDRLIRLGLGK
jgi:D-alanine---D-serine ligase